MKFAGIIAEYNPFHNGHAWQLSELRQRGAQTIAVCMSTGAVQRGSLPVYPESVRVRAALQAGADLVVALPVPYANASAETFAAAGVHLLQALGCDTLAFGAETPDAALLMQTARRLDSPAFAAALRSRLDAGLPFAAARSAAMETLDPASAALLTSPNNTLGVEYCKAILRSGARMQPLPLPRLGAGHGQETAGFGAGRPMASATMIRNCLSSQGLEAAAPYLPEAAMALYRDAAAAGLLSDPAKTSTAVLARLRGCPARQFAGVRGAGEGLENRLAAAVSAAETLPDLMERLKTKRYPTARLRRFVLDAVLDIPADGLPAFPPYLHLLGARRSALPLLGKATLPASTSLARLKASGAEAAAIVRLHSRAVDFSALCRVKTQPVGLAYTGQVVLL